MKKRIIRKILHLSAGLCCAAVLFISCNNDPYGNDIDDPQYMYGTYTADYQVNPDIDNMPENQIPDSK